jgi:hypothetical protein
MTNGSWYTSTLCGPRGAEDLSFNRWSQLYYAGYAEFDIDIVQAYAGLMLKRATQLGSSSAGEESVLVKEVAKSWFLRNPTLAEDKQAARFTYLMCKIWRKSDAGSVGVDAPQLFDEFASGSLAHITSSWAYESCKR